MKKSVFILTLLIVLVVSCTSRKHPSDYYPKNISDTEYESAATEPDSVIQDIPSKKPIKMPSSSYNPSRKEKELDNMRGFDPVSEDDMEDNGMSRYMENYDEEGWD